MNASKVIEGGCLCGHIRYRITGPVSPASYCHCKTCRHSAGAPVSAWISVAKERFSYIQGTPTVYESSPGTERCFCPRCGSQLTFVSWRFPKDIDVTLGTLDDPEAHPPRFHAWKANALSWMHLDEHLPAYEGFSPAED